MKRLLLLVALLSTTFVSKAQDYGKSVNEPITVQKLSNWSFPSIDGFDGSYQFLVKEKKDFIFTDETFKMIENARKSDQDFLLSLNPYLDVIILSKQKLSDPSAVRFTEVYKLN